MEWVKNKCFEKAYIPLTYLAHDYSGVILSILLLHLFAFLMGIILSKINIDSEVVITVP